LTDPPGLKINLAAAMRSTEKLPSECQLLRERIVFLTSATRAA
jgi:hypothetical protein